MRFGLTFPNVGLGPSPAVLADLSREAEAHGWDGVFVWDAGVPGHSVAPDPNHPGLADVIDPWLAMASIALATDRIIFGPMITPIARRRPWKLAQECVSLDHLSGGRLVLPVGLGWAPDPWFAAVGEPLDLHSRAERLDEGLAIIDALWRGEEVHAAGTHFSVDGLRLRPRPLQQPRIPVWVVAGWPSRKSIGRAARWDGVIPQRIRSPEALSAGELAQIAATVREEHGGGDFEIIVETLTSEHDRDAARSQVADLAAAGVTWHLESIWLHIYETPGSPEALLRRIRQGPPR